MKLGQGKHTHFIYIIGSKSSYRLNRHVKNVQCFIYLPLLYDVVFIYCFWFFLFLFKITCYACDRTEQSMAVAEYVRYAKCNASQANDERQSSRVAYNYFLLYFFSLLIMINGHCQLAHAFARFSQFLNINKCIKSTIWYWANLDLFVADEYSLPLSDVLFVQCAV